MEYMVVWTFEPHTSQAAIERFQQTGGLPPEGVTMITRLHDVAGRRGFALAKTDDHAGISLWCHQWNDLLKFEVIPVLDDEGISEMLAARG